MSMLVSRWTGWALALLLMGCSSSTVVKGGSGGSGGGGNGKCVVESPFNWARADDNGHCFAMSYATTSRTAAEAQCKLWNGHLASITSQQEQDFATKFLSDSTTKNSIYYAWIGLQRTGGKWSWSDGQAYSFKSFDAAYAPPASGDGCVLMLRASTWFWGFEPDCSQPNNYLCER